MTWYSPGSGSAARRLDYVQTWDLQRQLHEQRVRGEIPDTCLLLEHQPVYTAGRRTDPLDRPAGDPGAPVIDVDRGGKITWHGPGQLTGYPIVALPSRSTWSLTCHDRGGADRRLRGVRRPAGRVDGRSGVWLRGAGPGQPDRKVAAIGIRVARGVTMHGFALNCDCDLSWFDRIVPCGLRDASVTTLSRETGRRIAVDRHARRGRAPPGRGAGRDERAAGRPLPHAPATVS